MKERDKVTENNYPNDPSYAGQIYVGGRKDGRRDGSWKEGNWTLEQTVRLFHLLADNQMQHR